MNNLSWLIYWADALPKVATWLCFLSAILFIIFAFSFVLGVTNLFGTAVTVKYAWDKDEEYVPVEKVDTQSYALARRFQRIGYLAPLFFVLWGSSFLVPSKETFYLIAASEAGEQAIKTPEFSKVRLVINNWLDKESAAGDKSSNSSDNSTDTGVLCEHFPVVT